MSAPTPALQSIATKLETLYPTRIGRPAIETTSATLPVITIASTTDVLAAEQDYDEIMRTRQVQVEVKVEATATYHEVLDTSIALIRSALAKEADGTWLAGHAVDMRLGAVSIQHPDAGGKSAAATQLIEIDYFAD